MFVLSSRGPYTCVNCGGDNNDDVYKIYGNSIKSHHRSPSTADTSLSAKISSCRLSQCNKCHRYIDEYAQLDYNVLFLDAILQKHSFYRHILLNCEISHQGASKMAIAFLLCETFQHWTSLKPSSQFASKSYLQLELSFYLIFFCAIIENSVFNVIYYLVFKIFLTCRSKFSKDTCLSNVPSLFEIFLSIIVSSYGKLFLIPSYLYGGELREILDKLVYLFFIFSLIQCSAVKGKFEIRSISPYLIVFLTWAAHYLIYNLWIVPSIQFLFSSIITSDDYFFGIYIR